MAVKEGVWIVPDGGVDEFNDPLPSGEPRWLDGCVVLPRRSFENNTGRGLVIVSGYEIFRKPAPTEIPAASDNIIVRGEEHEVDGVPGVYPGGKALQLFTKKAGA